jgi:hypothetical protein
VSRAQIASCLCDMMCLQTQSARCWYRRVEKIHTLE